MPETFTPSPTLMGFVDIKDAPALANPVTQSLTITGSVDPAAPITLTKAAAAAWLTIPATCLHGVPFDVVVAAPNADRDGPKEFTETIEVSYAAYTTLEVVVTFKVRSGGPP